MKYAIISDIHSNIESLSKFMKIIVKHSVDKVINHGDVVEYDTDPSETAYYVIKI